MSLTVMELNESANILGNTSKTKTERVRDYYAYLASKGEDYGRLGLGVTDNGTWQGQIANGFAESGAKNNNKDMSYGSQGWADLNLALATQHQQAYVANNGGTPSRKQIHDYHNEEYDNSGLNADDWFPNKMLNESPDPDALWADWQTNDNPLDIWEDAIEIAKSGGGIVLPPYFMAQGLLDPSGLPAQFDFARNLFEALKGLSSPARADLAEDLGFPPSIVHLPDDYGWAFGELGKGVMGLLPDWLDGPTGMFDHGPKAISPLVLDLDGDGIELTRLGLGNAGSSAVYFDLDNDGFEQRTAWVTGGDGLLALDRNGNGIIDNQSELFGNGRVDGTIGGGWNNVVPAQPDGDILLETQSDLLMLFELHPVCKRTVSL
ncbi:MAG: hypothetical protein IT559_02655 [Alphaproteobacteria bacterium]|nr:hypothetical protein [Alphaproteobacteria bacterium]